MYLGAFNASAIVDFKFCTVTTTGAPTQLAGTPAISVYKSNSTTQSTTGVTLTVDFDAVTGLNHVRIDTSADGTFYATGNDFQVVITTGTVGGTSVVGYVVAHFSIRNRADLYPTTADRTLDVSATGEAGIDWANVGTPSSTVNLSATTVNLVNTATTVTSATVAAINANVITASAIADNAIDAGSIASGAITAAKFAAGAIDAAAIADSAIDRATFAADTGLQSARSNTAQAGGATSITLDASALAVTDAYKGEWIYLTGGTGAGQSRLCTAYNGTTKVATTAPAWATNPDATSTFAILPAAGIDQVSLALVLTTYTGNTPQTGDCFARLGAPAGASVSADIAAVQADTDNIQTRIPAALVSGRMDSSVGAMATGVITAAAHSAGAIDAAAIATGAIDADALAADVITDIWQGTALTEAYPADGAAGTPAQLLYLILSVVAEFAISGTTITCKKLDGTTTSATYTLDSSTTPTSRTRAT